MACPQQAMDVSSYYGNMRMMGMQLGKERWKGIDAVCRERGIDTGIDAGCRERGIAVLCPGTAGS